jgi:hypothetical protein
VIASRALTIATIRFSLNKTDQYAGLLIRAARRFAADGA